MGTRFLENRYRKSAHIDAFVTNCPLLSVRVHYNYALRVIAVNFYVIRRLIEWSNKGVWVNSCTEQSDYYAFLFFIEILGSSNEKNYSCALSCRIRFASWSSCKSHLIFLTVQVCVLNNILLDFYVFVIVDLKTELYQHQCLYMNLALLIVK